MSSTHVVDLLVENVCRNGTLLLNITQHGDGSLDDSAVEICKQIGAWLKANGEAIYGSRPFEVYGESDTRYTRAHDAIYAIVLKWPASNQLMLSSLKSGGATIGNVTNVTLLGQTLPLSFAQGSDGLTVSTKQSPLPRQAYVLKIEQDRKWINDDDPGVVYSGWIHQCNLNAEDFNNDLHVSNVPGDSCRVTFQGTGIDVIASTAPSYGKMKVSIEHISTGTIDLGVPGTQPHEQTVYVVKGLSSGSHCLLLEHLDSKAINVDAFRVHP